MPLMDFIIFYGYFLTSRQKVAFPKVFNLYCMLSELDKIKRSCCPLLLNDYEMSASLFRSGPVSLTVWSLTHNQQVCHLQVIISFLQLNQFLSSLRKKCIVTLWKAQIPRNNFQNMGKNWCLTYIKVAAPREMLAAAHIM